MTAHRQTRWTDQHWLALFCVVSTLVTGIVIGGRPRELALGLGAVTVLAGLAALCVDGFFALIVGVAAVGGALLLFHHEGVWGPQNFYLILVTSGLMALMSWLAGQLGASLRQQARARVNQDKDQPVRPVAGSLGMLDGASAYGLLQEEITRARHTRQPLTVLKLQVRPRDTGADAATRHRLSRAVARLVESQVRPSDIPFATAEDQLGVILPDTGAPAAWDIAGAVIDAAARASYADGTDQGRRVVADSAALHASLEELGAGTDADSLLSVITPDTAGPPGHRTD
ncbi:hypothetical protein [Luteipulveratus mongoliensis]|uniref:GGDEF domain-containing protein n=1 Tax=Luteipulveratus mongoliensis TaxID=571913 RepID=A0A0K1JIL4_9MICO|nr:hypothetical protein [Luteipulveratus mongoliensis]AKU16546.1 hypothetical protein VV02_12880 [Luteipulveratus mongoliensis]